MIHEDPDQLGYEMASTTGCVYCGRWEGSHLFGCPEREPGEFEEGVFEECPDCHGETFWRHPEFGPQPCVTCFGTGVVPHECRSRESDDEGAG